MNTHFASSDNCAKLCSCEIVRLIAEAVGVPVRTDSCVHTFTNIHTCKYMRVLAVMPSNSWAIARCRHCEQRICPFSRMWRSHTNISLKGITFDTNASNTRAYRRATAEPTRLVCHTEHTLTHYTCRIFARLCYYRDVSARLGRVCVCVFETDKRAWMHAVRRHQRRVRQLCAPPVIATRSIESDVSGEHTR